VTINIFDCIFIITSHHQAATSTTNLHPAGLPYYGTYPIHLLDGRQLIINLRPPVQQNGNGQSKTLYHQLPSPLCSPPREQPQYCLQLRLHAHPFQPSRAVAPAIIPSTHKPSAVSISKPSALIILHRSRHGSIR